MKRYKKLPPKNERRSKQFKVAVSDAFYWKALTLTFHTYGQRPKRGDVVRIRGGLYTGHLGKVTRRYSPFYRGYTYLAKVVHPTEWSK